MCSKVFMGSVAEGSTIADAMEDADTEVYISKRGLNIPYISTSSENRYILGSAQTVLTD